MVTIPKKLICKCKGYSECDACKTGRDTGQRVFDSSREYDDYAGLNSGQSLCPKCGRWMLRTETFRLKCGVCEEREVMCRALEKMPTGLNDEDVLNVVLNDGKHITQGWVRLIYGNGIDVISDYTVNLEQHMAEADRVRGAIEEDLMMRIPVDDVREVLAVLEPLADEVRDPHLAKLISMFKGAVR